MGNFMNIGVLIGSLRRGSFNRKIALKLAELAPQSMALHIIDISQLSFFNQDDEAIPPQSWVKFRETIKTMDGFIFVTPEYNRSLPAVLKNAIDIGSRPYGQSLWNSKPCAIVSASLGPMGGFGANHHLRQSLVCLNAPCMPQPEAYLSFVDKLFDASGHFTSENTAIFLKDYMNKFNEWTQRHLPTNK
jgi:chromate reductase